MVIPTAARRLLRLTSGAMEVLRRRMTGLETPFVFSCKSDLARPIPTQEHQTKDMEQLERFNAEQQIAAFERQSAMTQ